jgi:hypothetical protein
MMKMSARFARQDELSGDGSTPLRLTGSNICDFRQASTDEEEETYRLWSRRVLLFYASIVAILVILLAGNQIGPHRSGVTSIDRAAGAAPSKLPASVSPRA